MRKAVPVICVLLLACFANYVFAFSITSCPVTINDSSTLANDIIANADCIIINASNATLDCQGFTIYSNGSINAIYATNQKNITVTGCIIWDIAASGTNTGVYLTNVNLSYVYNNTIRLNSTVGGGYGIVLESETGVISHNNTIENNTITITHSNNDHGIYLTGGSINNTIVGNTITGQNGTGIYLGTLANANSILNNNITDVAGTKYLRGIFVHSNDSVIKYNTINFGGSAAYPGIYVRYGANNNIVADNNLSSSNYGSATAIYLSGVDDLGVYHNTTNHVENNTITITSPTSSATGISANYLLLPRIVNNVVTIIGAIADPLFTSIRGISVYHENDVEANATVMHNTVTISNTPVGVSSIGLYVHGSGSTARGNNATINNTTLGGLYAEGEYCVFENNRIEVNSDNATYVANFTRQNRTNMTYNTLLFSGSGAARGIYTESSSYNIFQSNNITATGANAIGIQLVLSNGTVFTRTVINNTLSWIIAGAETRNNFTNTTFTMPSGTLNIPGTFEINGSDEINKPKLNISNNKAHLNSTALPYLNITGIITLFGLNYTTPRLLVDWDDDGSFENCPAGTCTPLSGSPTAGYVFNVSHFTTFSTTEGGLTLNLTKTDSSDPITVANPLIYTITIAITNLDPTITNVSNLTLIDIYPAGVVFDSAQPTPVSGTNNTFALGNLTANQTIVVNITVNLPLALADTTINNTANLSYNNVNGTQINLTVTEQTTVQSAGGGGSGGGSGGGGSGGVYRPLNTTTTVGSCFENWVCDDWSECVNTKQTRECTDLNSCGTTKLKPKTEQDCIYTPKPLPKAAAEEPPAETYKQEPIIVVKPQAKTPVLDKVFYAIAVIALIALGIYLYWMHRKK